MSHYAVIVIHRDNQYIDDLLDPYSENLEVEPYLIKTKEQVIQRAKENRDQAIYDLKHRTEAVAVQTWMDRHFEAVTDDELYAAEIEYCGYRDFDDKGNVYSTYNPDSKWDWWVEGGRFSDFLKLKPEAVDPEWPDDDRTSSARFVDLDFSLDQEAYDEALEFWDAYVDKKHNEDDEDPPFSLYSEQYYKEYYTNRETYAKYMAQFTSYAVLTPDGKWHALGNVGWFGYSDETPEALHDWHKHYYDRFIKPYQDDPSMVMTVVDCHI